MSNSCRRWRSASDLRIDPSCKCIVDPEAQWKELFRAKYPDFEPPMLTGSDTGEFMMGIRCDDYGLSSAALTSIEEHDSGSSVVTFNPSGHFTPSSSNAPSSQVASQIILQLQHKVYKLKLRQEQSDKSESDLKSQNISLQKRNSELEQRLREMEQCFSTSELKLQEVVRLFGFVWDAYEDQTDPQSRHRARLQRAVAETVPSVFMPLDPASSNGRTQSSVGCLVPSQRPEGHEFVGEGTFAPALQLEDSLFGMLSVFDDPLTSSMPTVALESSVFEDLLPENDLGD